MTNTISLVADHKGHTRPTVVGDEYEVIGDITISAYRTGSIANASVNINAAVDETYIRLTTGNFSTDGFQAGDLITIAGSAGANDLHLSRILSITTTTIAGDTITVGPRTALTADTGGGEVITHAGEKVLASAFGLNRINSVEILGQHGTYENWLVNTIAADGSSFNLVSLITGSAGLLAASLSSGALAPVRVKVTGLL